VRDILLETLKRTRSPTTTQRWPPVLRFQAGSGVDRTTIWHFAGVLNTISNPHQAYLAAGGLTALIGDGMLPHPGAEKIIEVYYNLPIFSWQLSFDYQFITNPAYNRDRGPVSVVATRLHAQF
jgi:hypothetical protein